MASFGLGSVGTASFSGGLMKGLQQARQERREDEADAMRKKLFDQRYSQDEQLFPERLQAAKNTNEASGLTLNKARRDEQISKADYDALMAVWQGSLAAADAAKKGNPMALNENNALIMEKFQIPTTIWTPTPDGKIGRYDPNDMSQPIDVYSNLTDASNAYIKNTRALFEQLSPTAFKAKMMSEPKAQEQNWSLGSSGYAIDAKSGRTKQVFTPQDEGSRGGAGGLKTNDENTLNRWIEGYYGKRDEQGQFILSADDKYKAVTAQNRAVNMLRANPNMSMTQAYSLAVASVSGGMQKDQAEALAKKEAEEKGIMPEVEGTIYGTNPNPDYQPFIDNRTQELMQLNQQDAVNTYNKIVGGQQTGLGLNVPRQQQTQQPKTAAPQIPSGRTGMLNGRKVVVTNDNHVFDATTGEQLQ